MIVDVFMFNQEFDMLDCRLYELEGVVDRFIAIEADHTFTGEPKPYYLSERSHDYPQVEVVRAQTSDIEGIPSPNFAWVAKGSVDHWRREAKQRESAEHLLTALPDDAVILMGDLDEIPMRDVVASWDGKPSVLVMYMAVYSLRLKFPGAWAGTVVGRRRDLHSFVAMRNTRWQQEPLTRTGWHLTWFGKPEDRLRKMSGSAHQEMSEHAHELAYVYPEEKLHVDGKTELVPWDAPLPRWVEAGLAPSHWT